LKERRVTTRIGIIGCGVMGADHARLLSREIAGGELVAVQDRDLSRAAAVAASAGGVRIHGDAADLIADRNIDAILIASPDLTHAPLTMACIEAGKPVLCEKPLAATLEECRAVVQAEIGGGRRLVQVGFMRRFDPGYLSMRQSLDSERYGRALFFHCIHRNAVAPDYITSDLIIANSSVHEIDIARFLLDEEFKAVTVIGARPSRRAMARRPLFIALESMSGVLVTIEAFLDAGYGYDVQAELVCEEGTISLAPNPPISHRFANRDGFVVADDWRARFADAYRLQLKGWIASIETGRPCGSSAWDGYASSVIAAAALQALAKGERTAIAPDERPAFYTV
jgi:myo-inositol 2-dehydrogenase / D-chiro-inositol 1-dehydrogenase